MSWSPGPAGSLVVVKLRGRGRLAGLVARPEQQFFPRPTSVFVQFGDRVLLITVTELELVR